MKQAPAYFARSSDGAWRLDVWVQPGAKKSEVAGTYQDRLKIRLAAPAVDNKANKALVRFVASLMGVRASAVRLANGLTSRKKTLFIELDQEPDLTEMLGGAG